MEGLHPKIAANLAQSEADGGVWLKDVPVGKTLLIQTRNTLYRLEHRAEKEWWIEGNARFCPVPTKTVVSGSTWGGSMLKIGFIGIGMLMEFNIEGFSILTTSSVQDVKLEG